MLKISEAVVRRRCIRDANRIDAVLPYDTRREKASSHKLTLTKRFNMALLTMSFCYSSMASEDRYEYAVAVINRETDIIERMAVDKVEHERSEVGTKKTQESGHNLHEPILDPIMSQKKERGKNKSCVTH